MLLGMSFLSVSSGAAGQKSRENSLAAIEAGTSIVERPDVLAVATGAMVTGADCAIEPCWAAVQADAPLDVEGESEEPRLASTKSNAILKRPALWSSSSLPDNPQSLFAIDFACVIHPEPGGTGERARGGLPASICSRTSRLFFVRGVAADVREDRLGDRLALARTS